MKEIVGGNPEKDYGVFNNFREKLFCLSNGLITGGFASVAFTIASGSGLAMFASGASIVAGIMTSTFLDGAIEGEHGFSSKIKGAFYTGLTAPFVVAAGLLVNQALDNQETIIEQNNRILEQVEPFKAFEPQTFTL